MAQNPSEKTDESLFERALKLKEERRIGAENKEKQNLQKLEDAKQIIRGAVALIESRIDPSLVLLVGAGKKDLVGGEERLCISDENFPSFALAR